MRGRTIVLTGMVLICGAFALGGDLNPPAGPVAPTPGPEPRIPINATNAPGDADSLYKITQPGSYYLTGNLTGVASKYGIEVAASNVTIDLMGFELRGVPGSLDGIATRTAGLGGIDVRNGSVSAWGGDGVDCAAFIATDCRFDGLRLTDNIGGGMRSGSSSIVTSCLAARNTTFGFRLSTASAARGCIARENLNDGFNAGSHVTITDCIAYDNTADGISVDGDSIVARNSCDSNGGVGIHILAGDCRIEDNNCIDNDLGISSPGVVNIIVRNTCSGNAINWNSAQGNIILVIDATGVGAAFSGDAGGVSPGSSNPSANYTY